MNNLKGKTYMFNYLLLHWVGGLGCKYNHPCQYNGNHSLFIQLQSSSAYTDITISIIIFSDDTHRHQIPYAHISPLVSISQGHTFISGLPSPLSFESGLSLSMLVFVIFPLIRAKCSFPTKENTRISISYLSARWYSSPSFEIRRNRRDKKICLK